MSQRTRKILPILSFRSIPGVDGGETMLTVHPPDESDEYFSAFVGGSCVGTKPTMEQACVLLLEHAKMICIRQTTAANRLLMHYSKELDQLNKEGLTSR